MCTVLTHRLPDSKVQESTSLSFPEPRRIIAGALQNSGERDQKKKTNEKKIKKQRKEFFFSNYRNLKGCKNSASSFLTLRWKILLRRARSEKQLILKCQCFLEPCSVVTWM